MESRRSSGSVQGVKLFTGLRFHFVGFDRSGECQLVDTVERLGGTHEQEYSDTCSHVVVSADYTYDEPICAAARKDGKAFVTKDWVDDCMNQRVLLDAFSVLYTPVRNRSGIPGAKLLCICLTGYQGVVRREVEKMVHMMGAAFSKPLVLHKVTHLICYKFEGDKYSHAKQHGLKIVNHRWIEACLKSWTLVNEKDYFTSGEEAQAREIEDSQPEPQPELQPEPQVIEVNAEAASGDVKQEKIDEAKATENVDETHAEAQVLAVQQEAAQKLARNAEAGEKSVDSEATTQRYEQGDEEDGTSAAKPLASISDEVVIVPEVEKGKQVEETEKPSTPRSTPSSSSSKKRKSSSVSEKGETSRARVKRKKVSRSRGSRSSTKSGGKKGSNREDEPMDVDKSVEKSKDEGSSRRAISARRSPEAANVVIDVDEPERREDIKPGEDAQAEYGRASNSPIEIQEEKGSELSNSKANRTRTREKRKTKRSDMVRSKEKIHYFALSGHSAEKQRFTASIRRLAGHVCRDDHQWKDQTTHCVMNLLRRTEKFFAACASGRWILKFEYLEASERAGMFVDEEKYEWSGTEVINGGMIDLSAPKRWRLIKRETGCGAFEDMRVIIYGPCMLPPLHTLERAIKAGGGTVVATKPPFVEHLISGVDFAIIALGIPQDDHQVVQILRHKVACVRDEFFVDYICKPSSSRQKHILFNTNLYVDKALNRLEKLKVQRSRMLARAAKSPSVSEDDKEDPACCVCHSRGNEELMLLCDGCDQGTHTFCCDPPLPRVPKEDWYCQECKAARNK